MSTIVLAAGAADHKSVISGQTASLLMNSVNGRPVISWVLGNILKETKDSVTIVVRASNRELVDFLAKIYGRNKRVSILAIKDTQSILETTLLGVGHILRAQKGRKIPLRIVLGDTLLKGIPFGKGDKVYVSTFRDVSEKWCLAFADKRGRIKTYFDKVEGLSPQMFKALVGRYEFTDAALFKRVISTVLSKGKRELSDALTLYADKLGKPMTAHQIPSKAWIDFGHLEGVSNAQKELMESRSFNTITVHTPVPVLRKRSRHVTKLKQEVSWYKNLPLDLQAIAPRVLSSRQVKNVFEIEMEYYGYPTLTEKYVYAGLPSSFWQAVLKDLFSLMTKFQSYHSPKAKAFDLRKIYDDKTFERLESLGRQAALWRALLHKPMIKINGIDRRGVPLLKDFIKAKVARMIKTATPSLVHGDFCFNNILYDVGSGIIKLIDPRGCFGGNCTSIYGDIRYDIAKLRHSFCGGYDHIVEGFFDVNRDKKNGFTLDIYGLDKKCCDVFDQLASRFGYKAEEIRFIEALLFLSMTPLHQDSLDKQLAFLIQGLIKMNDCFEAEAT